MTDTAFGREIDESLRLGGWTRKDDLYWYHPDRLETGYTAEQALEIQGLEQRAARAEQTRDALVEVRRKQRWKDGEAAGISYYILSDTFLFEPVSAGSQFKEMIKKLEDVLASINHKDREPGAPGALVYVLVKKKYDKVQMKDGAEITISEHLISILFKWNGKRWVSIFGGLPVRVPSE